ncbi:MAG: 3-deoxy-D-manno-octulosonic acid transferase [Cytophagales bacterium]|jgi:3-deoxy-D-manno-octulosonic-acid transferase|nr:3-deoxy-D-manno-octulosonic acid transferase [Cytophagales bacterium]
MWFYSLSIGFLRLAYRVAAWFHPKARLFVNGRSKIFNRLQSDFAKNEQKVIWMHCASLGEFEQGRPVLERIRKDFPGYKILLTFFSPSGYEIRKNYTGADYIYYLPWDSRNHARRFIEITKPVLAIFVKYEFWYHYTNTLSKKSIPLISISSIFRNNQSFFQWYGGFFRGILKKFNHFFVQNKQSADLLIRIGITPVTLAGDTRFDRVHAITRQNKVIEVAEKFKGTDRTFVVGSLWPEDLEVLAPFINEHKQSLKFIIAPHEITESFLHKIEESVDAKCIRFSQAGEQNDASVLIIDNIGMLSALYRYGEFAYVGGAFGKGLHNILEAACYGIPVFFGNKNYEKFKEATELIMRGGAFAVSGYSELESNYELMVSRPENFLLACEVTKAYVTENLGATDKIMNYCRTLLTA